MASDIKVGLVPVGKRSDGSTGLFVDSNGKPKVSVLEVLASLPTADDANNFDGRLVFETGSQNIYVWYDAGPAVWIALQNVAVTVDEDAPTLLLSPNTGDLYYSLNTEVLYLFDGTSWVSVGGIRGASILWEHYTADGATSLYSTGASTNPPVEFVQVFLDGLTLRPGTSLARDYYMVGGSVQLNDVPTNGQLVSIRTVSYKLGNRNSSFSLNRYVSDGTSPNNSYGTGVLQAHHGQVFVTVDGVAQQGDVGLGAGTYDYRFEQQNILIDTMTAVGTTVTVTTEADHGLDVGSPVQIFGAAQTQYNGSYTVSDVVSDTIFKYIATLAPSSSPATPNPVLFFGPVTQNDAVVFVNSSGADTNVPSGAVVCVRSIENIISTAAFGGVDTQPFITVTESGSGVGIYKEKSGSQLVLKTLVEGTNVTISETATEITIASRFATYERYTVYNGIPASYEVNDTDDVYIAVKNVSGSPVEIDMSAITVDALFTGRRLFIKDAGQNAGTHNISLQPAGGVRIEAKDGQSYGAAGAPLVLNTDGEAVWLVFNGADWEMGFRHPGQEGDTGPTGDTGPPGDDGNDTFVERAEIDGATDPYIVPDPISYVGVSNTSGSTVTVDVYSEVASGESGRKIVVKDEGGNAATHNIIIDPGPSRKIDGGSIAATLAISTNRGSVTLVYDGGSTYHTI